MKALTLQQPWATLIAIGAKSVETRGWHPKQNPGTLVICSSKKPITGPAHQRMLSSEPFASHLEGHETPRSAMLAVATLKVCIRTEQCHVKDWDPREVAFGDYRPGRWAWLLENVVKLDAPIPLSEPPKPRPGQRRKKPQFRLGVWELLPKDERKLAEALGQNVYEELTRKARA